MTAPITKKEAQRTIAAVEKALAAGFPHPQNAIKNRATCISEASRTLGLPRSTVHSRIIEGMIERIHGLRVNWLLYVAPKKDETPADPIEIRRLQDQKSLAEARAKAAERAHISNTSLREGVFRLASVPPEPPEWKTTVNKEGKHREALVCPIGDIHGGEVVDLQQMAGRNTYNNKIMAARIERLFHGYVRFGKTDWIGPAPEILYLVLLGDLITGEIHEELAKTNDLLSIPAVRRVSECLIAGIDLLLREFDCEIRVISLPGNHGRTTRKPEAKNYAVDSYDTLVAWNIESWFAAKKIDRVKFSAPASGDALVSIHGWNFLFTHGDRIGSRGGQGMIGPAATISRGMQKVIMDYAADGVIIDFVIVGHFHTALELEQGFANGPLIGPTEYSKSGRMKPLPASQWFISVHPDYGIARRQKIYVGRPEEGSIYRSRA